MAEGIANGPDEIRGAIRYQVKYGADLIKICATGGVISVGDTAGAQQYSTEELRTAVETAHMLERRVAAHAHGTEGIKAAVRAGVDSDGREFGLLVAAGLTPMQAIVAGTGTAAKLLGWEKDVGSIAPALRRHRGRQRRPAPGHPRA
ncbi:MAG: hypothetical protein DMF98_17375 [Acidobacteria bacterium]|nr:MAG: hypothetical protein DMF98_17375 [Acidobacteriota bacterium]